MSRNSRRVQSRWRRAGFDDVAAAEWKSNGIGCVRVAVWYRRRGVSPVDAGVREQSLTF